MKDIIDGVPYARTGRGGKQASLRAAEESAQEYAGLAPEALGRVLNKLEKEMFARARNLEFEEAAAIRDRIEAIKARNLGAIESGIGGI